MVTQILLLATFLVWPTGADNDPALKAIQELYQYATQAVQVEPAETQRLLANVEAQLESPSGEVARIYERLVAEVRTEQPDGREIRVIASDLYRVVENQEG
jgi:hypothetical protein